MSPSGGWNSQTIRGTAGERRERQTAAVAAASPEVEQRREREARLEARMEQVDPHSPEHARMERVLLAARKMRKRLEKDAKPDRAGR